MKNYRILIAALLISLIACKAKKKDDREKYIPILSFIKSQIADIDTSLYSIRKIVIQDSLHSDTSFVKREEFRGLAKDFLELPELSMDEFMKRYKEEKIYDESMKRIIIHYTPNDPDKEEIQKEQVLIANTASGDKFTNFIIDKISSDRDGSLEKNLLWNVDKSFQVSTTTQKPGQPEVTTILKVAWNEKENE